MCVNEDRLKLSLQQDEICTILIVCVPTTKVEAYKDSNVWKKYWFQGRTLRNATNQESCVKHENS